MSNQINHITGLPNRISQMNENVVINGTLTVNGLFTNAGSLAASSYSLGAAASYVILTNAALTVTTGQVVQGNVGQLGAPTGNIIFINGADYPVGSGQTNQALTDAAALYNQLTGLTPTFSFITGAVVLNTVDTGNGAGHFTPGIYKGDAAASTTASSVVTLDGAGDYVFIFNGALTTGANTIFNLTNGATAGRVFWATSAALTTGANTLFVGNEITPAAITTGANTNLQGRIISTNAAISTGAANSINLPA